MLLGGRNDVEYTPLRWLQCLADAVENYLGQFGGYKVPSEER